MKWRVLLAVAVVLCLSAPLVSAALYTDMVSGTYDGGPTDGGSAWLSVDGNHQLWVYQSDAANIVSDDTNGVTDIFAYSECQYPFFDESIGRINYSWSGEEANGTSSHPVLSAYNDNVAFQSLASNLVESDTNDASDIFVTYIDHSCDGWYPNMMLVSVNSLGEQGNGGSYDPSITEYGYVVSYTSTASNLVADDTNEVSDIFVTNIEGETIRVSVSSEGVEANGPSYLSTISHDGRYVVYVSEATNLVDGDDNGVADVFLADLDSQTTERISVNSDGIEANGASVGRPVISWDGRFVAFTSAATDLVPGDSNGSLDVFLRDRVAGTTELISVADSGDQSNNDSFEPSISANGQVVLFTSLASNLVDDDANGVSDVFLRERYGPLTARISAAGSEVLPSLGPSLALNDVDGNGPSSQPFISNSDDCDFPVVTFTSQASNLVSYDYNGDLADVFTVDLSDEVGALVLYPSNSGGPTAPIIDGSDYPIYGGVIDVNGKTLVPIEGEDRTFYFFQQDEQLSIEAVPDPGFRFVSWDCCWAYAESNPIQTRVQPDERKCLTVVFEPIPYTVHVDGTNGTLVVNDVEQTFPFEATYYYGDQVRITVAADTGRVFSGWSGDVTGNDNPLDLTIESDLIFTAHFPLPTVSLHIAADGDGSVSVDGTSHGLPWSGDFAAGATVELEAVPDAGRFFGGWTGDVSGEENPTELVMLEDSSVTASFTTSEVTLTLDGEVGSVKVDGVKKKLPWSGVFLYGTTVALEAVPDDCDRFDGWSGALTGMTNPTTIHMNGNRTVTADFMSLSMFSDVGCSHWAARYIAACYDAGIVQGIDGKYLPDGTVDRAAMATYVARALTGNDVPAGPVLANFDDVPADYWAYDAVEYAFAHNIVLGYGNRTYLPTLTVDRGQMAVFIARSIVDPLGDEGLADYTPPTSPSFSDVTSDSVDWAWCYEYVEYLHGLGIVQGYGTGAEALYNPAWAVTRDMMAAYIARAFELPL
jgi:hypothetical protein